MPTYSRIYTEITTVCNGSCSFCPGTVRKKEFISVQRYSDLLDRISGFTEYVYMHLMGEPLLHPELSELISLARAKGFKPCITTNGKLLPRVGKSLIEAGVYKVSISVHSFEQGSREEYLDYLNGCIDFADAASSLGVLMVFRLWNKGYDEGRNIDTVSLLKERFTDAWVENGGRARLRNRLHLEYGERFDWPDVQTPELGERAFCYGLADHFGILTDGTVVPCCLDRDGIISLGNVYTEPLESILSSDRATKMRDGFRKKLCTEELCRKCGYSRRFKI